MKVTKDQLIKLLGKKISENLAKTILEQTKKDLESKLQESGFDMDDFFFSDAEAAARADMQSHYGEKMVHAKLGDKEDTQKFLQGQLDATEDDVDQHASHLKSNHETFNQKLVGFLTKDRELARLRDEDPRALLDTIALAAYKYIVDHNSASPFILALQNWIVELDHEYEPSGDDLASVNMNAYQRLSKFEPIYNKNMERDRLNEVLSRLEERPVERHYSIVFQQGDDAMETMNILDQQGADEAIEHLLQWYEGDGELSPTEDGGPVRGTQDHEHRMVLDDGTYILNWNNHIPYVGLSKMKTIELPAYDPHEFDDLYDGVGGNTTVQEDVDDMDIDDGHLSDDPTSAESMAAIDDVSRGFYVVPPKGDDPLWYVVDQDGDPVQGYNTEEEAREGLRWVESPEDEQQQYGVDFKESRLARIDKLMNEAFELIKEYRSMGGYPVGADHDPSAPWNIVEPKPLKRKPKEVFSLTDSNDECMILHHGGSYYAFYKDALEPEQVESIAINYVGVPSEVERGENGYDTTYDTSNYRSAKYLPEDALVDHINDNYAHMKVGEGVEAWEDGSYDLVRIDHALAKELRATWHNLSVPIS